MKVSRYVLQSRRMCIFKFSSQNDAQPAACWRPKLAFIAAQRRVEMAYHQ